MGLIARALEYMTHHAGIPTSFFYVRFSYHENNVSEFLICTTGGFCDGKTSNVASSPRRLSGPLRFVKLEGPTDDKVDACAHDPKCHSIVLDSSIVQIESSSLRQLYKRP